MFFVVILALTSAVLASLVQPRQRASIPDFVTKYAPLVYLDQNELYLPSDIGAQLNNTFPAINFAAITGGPSPPLLSNLEQLNSVGSCTQFAGCNIYLTSKDNITANPPWLYGVMPDPVTFKTVGARSCAIITNDHGDGTVDAFYMYFYAFNLGETVLGQLVGDHVGDWEHTMVRFVNGKPNTVWYSQHDSGQVFTYESLSKIGDRPIVYSAIGTHANFAVSGIHTRIVDTAAVNDYTSNGPMWDPTLSAYYYTYTASSAVNGTFAPSDSSTPVSWLYFLGAWGDRQYPDSDPRQVNFLNLNITWKYTSGPTGPLDKNLNRTGTCPDKNGVCTTLSALPVVSGSTIPVTVVRPSTSASSNSSTTGTAAITSKTTGSSTTSSAVSAVTGSKSAARQVGIGLKGPALGIFVALVLQNLMLSFL